MRRSPCWIVLALLPLLSHARSLLDAHSGDELTVHYVALRGDMKLDRGRKAQLETEYRSCADTNQRFGREVSPLPPGGIPAVTVFQEIDLYYATGQSLAEIRGALYSIDRNDCRLVRRELHELRIYHGSARCDVDLLKREQRGFCDEDGAGVRPAVDRSKVPPHMQHIVDEQLARLQRDASARKNIAAPIQGSGQMKTVAGLRCEVYPVSGGEKCVARLAASRFEMSDGPMNAGMPGVLLAVDDLSYTLRATEVKLNLGASKSLFRSPPGMRSRGGGK